MAGALEAPAPLVVVGQLAVVHDGDVGERIGPVGVGVGDVDVGLGRHPHVPDPVAADVAVELVGAADGLGVAEVLDDLQRVPQRQHLDAADRLDVVGQRLEVAVVVERRRDRVLVDLLDRRTCAPARAPRLDLAAAAAQPVGDSGSTGVDRSASLIRRIRLVLGAR